MVAVIAGMAVLWWRLGGPVRRRVVVMLAPSGALYLIGMQAGEVPGYPEAAVTLSLIVGFIVLCLVFLKGWERLTHLVALGRQAEKEAGAADQTTPAPSTSD